MIAEGSSMGFAFDVRDKGGGSSASGWSRHGIWTPLCGLLLKVCDVKFHKMSFSSVLFNLMFKIVQRLQQETIVLFTHKTIKFREREHESRDGIRRSRHVDNYSYFPIVWSGSKGGGKKVIKGLKLGERKVDMSKPLSRLILISCKLSRNFMQCFQA